MKLRILNNSIRLRLNQTEVNTFAQEGIVSAELQFGINSLVYSLKRDHKSQKVEANFEGNEISILVPVAIADQWILPEEVGFENDDQAKVKLLIEKDFQCLHKRPNEDESDSFPNPLATR
ncbi:hypothetical protein N6H18_00570 [Reichenbachiella agarivorans]|uniref:Uncharacterized protein n=1 Tax=Reichenbachiella agarivorans TaxID=2979464 RepID=A0ABY6CSP3_9BACT|nr:hypothetical protein [Reichenbachiella agarivorans]UXP32468.1 hypothetical protein N6H18_00570 [Reichenbachiella agarivorans]